MARIRSTEPVEIVVRFESLEDLRFSVSRHDRRISARLTEARITPAQTVRRLYVTYRKDGQRTRRRHPA